VDAERQLAVRCGGCSTESRHAAHALLTLTAVCRACGRQLVEEGRAWGRHFDDSNAFALWAEVVMGLEDRLSIPSPSIPDGNVFGTKPHVELTLFDLVRTVAGYVPAGVEADRLVLESAGQIAGRPVSVADMGLPILEALQVSQWAQRHAAPGTLVDPK
jgi:hypothetical protein